ncbi:MAG: hypothetical protein JNK32_07890 [Anaerolineales bacterium]|nr:hypothetical protein [Anaerolineales bacterium]
MAYTLNYEEAGFIRLFYEGDAKLKDMKEVIEQGVALAREKNCFRVLSDFRAMRLNLSVVDLFSIPAYQASQSKELNVPFQKFRRAVVVPNEDFDNYKFFENVAVNRSHQVKIFIDPEDAIAWLLEK